MKAKLSANVGSYDAAARFVVGCGLLLFLNHGHTWGFAGLPLIATVAGICPIYWLLGINTAASDRSAPPRAARWTDQKCFASTSRHVPIAHADLYDPERRS